MGQCYEREHETSSALATRKADQVELRTQLKQKSHEYSTQKHYKLEGNAPEEQLVSYAANMKLLDDVTQIQKVRSTSKSRLRRDKKEKDIFVALVRKKLQKSEEQQATG